MNRFAVVIATTALVVFGSLAPASAQHGHHHHARHHHHAHMHRAPAQTAPASCVRNPGGGCIKPCTPTPGAPNCVGAPPPVCVKDPGGNCIPPCKVDPGGNCIPPSPGG